MSFFGSYKGSDQKVLAEVDRHDEPLQETIAACAASPEYTPSNLRIIRDSWGKFNNSFRSRVRWHPFFRDLGMTAATEFALLASSLVLVSLFGRLLGAVALGEYLLLRRVITGLQPPVQLGLGTALPRYVAHTVNRPGGEREAYFLSALTCLIGAALGSGLVLIAGQQYFARWLFGNVEMIRLVLPLSIWLLGLAAQAAVYGYYRGCLAMGLANTLQLCSLGVVPVLAVVALFRTGSVALLMSVMGLSMFLLSGLFAVPIVRRLARTKPSHLTRHARELLSYGVGRVPGIFGAAMLFAAGPVIASHYVPLAQVSYLLLGLSMLKAVSYSTSPLGTVLLSKVTMMRAENRLVEVQTHLGYLLSAVMEVSAFVCLQVLVFADVLIRIWVGPRFLDGTSIIRLLMLGIPFYVFATALRSALDAASWRPYNTGNVLAALALFLALAGAATRVTSGNVLLEAIAGALAATLAFFAWLTSRVVRRFYGLRVPWGPSAAPILFGLLLGGAGFLFHWARGARTGAVELISLELCLAALFIVVLMKRGSPWVLFLWNTAFPRR